MEINELNAQFASDVGNVSGLLMGFALAALLLIVLARPEEDHGKKAQIAALVASTLSLACWLISLWFAFWASAHYTRAQVTAVPLEQGAKFTAFRAILGIWPWFFLAGMLTFAVTVGAAGFLMSRRAGIFTLVVALTVAAMLIAIWYTVGL
jgi:hypothetical protein